MGRKLIFGLFAIVIAASFVFISGDVIAAEKKKEAPTQFSGILAYRTGQLLPRKKRRVRPSLSVS